jgi:hypothetical protein
MRRSLCSNLFRKGANQNKRLLPNNSQETRIQSGLRRSRPIPEFESHHSNNQQERSFWSYPKRKNVDKQDKNDVGLADPEISMPARHTNYPTEPYDAEIQALLDSPMGTAFGPSMWVQAEKYLEYILEKEDIPQAFRLLDRLVQERDAKVKLNHDLIYLTVQQWLTMYTNQQRHATKYPISIYPPLTVWRKLEAYQREGVLLESRTLHRVMEGTALVKWKKSDSGPVLAEAILEKMMNQSKHEHPMLRPSTFTFNAVLMAWEGAAHLESPSSHMCQVEAPTRALQLLEQLKTLYQTGWGNELVPNRNTYRRVMNIFARKGDGDRVEALLEELYGAYLEHGHEHENLMPTTAFFSCVLYAWSKSKDPLAAERAVVILDRMLELEKGGEIPGLHVTAIFFNIVMVCWSRRRSEESAVKVQALFDRLVELSKTDSNKKPIGGSYTALMTTWSRLDAEKADVAFLMWKREHDAGNCDMRMDSKLFGSLIGAWYNSKAPDRAERCDKLLQYALEANLEFWEPTVTVFNMTIHAFCRKKTLEGVERAEALLRQMEAYRKTQKSSDLKPTINTYVPVIHTWAALGHVERADGLLREWFEQHGQEEEAEISTEISKKKRSLDTRTFNQVLKAWLTKASILPQAADRAEEMLLNMSRLGVKPDSTSFQFALDCRRRSRSSIQGEQGNVAPRIEQVIALLDREYKRGGLVNLNNESYLGLRQGWSVLTI